MKQRVGDGRVATVWLLAIASVCCVVGVWVSPQVVWLGSLAWLMTGIACVISALYWRRPWMIGLCVVGGLCIGGWRGAGEIRQ